MKRMSVKIGKKVAMLLLFVVLFSTQPLQAQEVYGEEALKFAKVIDLVKENYVDTVDIQNLVDIAIVEVLKELDPHSVYISPKDVERTNERLRGNFEGIGVTYNILNDTVYIIKPTVGGPSEALGIRAGDRIVEVEGKNIAGVGINTEGVRSLLLGSKGTKVTVGVKRKGVTNTLYFTIMRDKIPIYSVDAAYMVNEETGYIKINSFAGTTSEEFKDAFDKLKKAGMRNLMLDLQDNGGGYMSTAEELADEFLDENKLIVFTEGEHNPREERGAFRTGCFEKGRLVLLIDEGSASASEIVSGAIQDWDRGVIVGRRSFGKGLVQKGYSMRDNSIIRLTIARYYTPTGRSIQKPYSKDLTDYRDDINKRYKHGELTNKDSISFPDSLKYYTLQNKRLVYGGGGIMPDVFVPLDTTSASTFYSAVVRGGYINTFILIYLDENREMINEKFAYFDDFYQNFQISDDFLNDLLEYLISEKAKSGTPIEEAKIEQYKKDIIASKEDLARIAKAILARDIWSDSEYFQIINNDNDIFRKAVEVISDKQQYKQILQGKE